MVCRQLRGNALTFNCIYHQWSFGTKGNLQGVPFRRGQKDATGMPKDFDPAKHNLRQLRVESFRGLVFATFSESVGDLAAYIGAEMRPFVERIFHKPIEYLGCTRQYSDSNWKLYMENVKDPYHASLLHLFHTTFNIFRVGMKAKCIPDATHGLHSIIYVSKNDEQNASEYKSGNIRSYDDGFKLEDDSILAMHQEYEEVTTNHHPADLPATRHPADPQYPRRAPAAAQGAGSFRADLPFLRLCRRYAGAAPSAPQAG